MLRSSSAVAFVLAAALTSGAVRAQTAGSPNEIEAKAQLNVLDKGDVWVLKFRFYPPRLITVDIPGRGRRVCWYLLYSVTNPDTKEPHRFIPDFELVTNDRPGVFHDQVLPTVQRAVQKIEDPTGHLNIQNSVTIAGQPLPPAKADATPRWVTGVAIWDDVAPDTNQFSVFVSGLSNGWAVAEEKQNQQEKEVIRRKTLQLNFRRVGDRNNQDARDIRFVPPEVWLYRPITIPEAPAQPPAPKKEGAAPAPRKP